jgi:hypothetical protein
MASSSMKAHQLAVAVAAENTAIIGCWRNGWLMAGGVKYSSGQIGVLADSCSLNGVTGSWRYSVGCGSLGWQLLQWPSMAWRMAALIGVNKLCRRKYVAWQLSG